MYRAYILSKSARSPRFRTRFWNEGAGCLYDVIDCDHQPGVTDPSLRPNQIFAVGGLPLALLEDNQARSVVEAVEAHLWTPLGLRSLAPGEPGYVPRYEGGVRERDGAYHQGTVWPWLLGPFVEAWVRVRGNTPKAKREARVCFLEPLLRHLDEAGLGHISEIADGDPPPVTIGNRSRLPKQQPDQGQGGGMRTISRPPRQVGPSCSVRDGDHMKSAANRLTILAL